MKIGQKHAFFAVFRAFWAIFGLIWALFSRHAKRKVAHAKRNPNGPYVHEMIQLIRAHAALKGPSCDMRSR